ncbi:MAG: hypothetical protein SAK29_19940 [Scytonema sp. PMC 1069.18]|nr:hypothetical protein [Scytonema sp. PMC 1069.18]MEC4887483.1 hypothetical protein [Scytonema sp. PMC 1070.18]
MVNTFLIYSAIAIYFLMAYCFFNEWLYFFLADDEMTSEQRFLSSIILIAATIIWPIVVPLAYLELLKFHKKHKSIIDFLRTSSSKSKMVDE